MSRSDWTRDPFSIANLRIPDGMSYQWNVLSTGIACGWKVVPFERHKRLFSVDYLGAGGEIVCGGLVLMEKPKHEIVQDHRKTIDKAHENHRKALEKIQQAAAGSNCEVSIKVTHERRLDETRDQFGDKRPP